MTNPPLTECSIDTLDNRFLRQFLVMKRKLDGESLELVILSARAWVRDYPNVYEFRKLLREAELRWHLPDHSIRFNLPYLRSQFRGRLLRRRKDCLQGLWDCEQVLFEYPLNLHANRLLADYASRLKWPETEIFARQTLLKNPNRIPEDVMDLARVYLDQNRADAAFELCSDFLQLFPDHVDLIDYRNRASVQQSMETIKSHEESELPHDPQRFPG